MLPLGHTEEKVLGDLLGEVKHKKKYELCSYH